MQIIQNYLSVIESLSVIVGVVFIALQLKLQSRISRADHDRQKKQSTIEFYNYISSENRIFLSALADKPLTYESSSSQEKIDANKYLGLLERLAVGVATKIYDFEILCLISGRYLSEKKYGQFKNYIDGSRKANQAPQQFIEFERLVGKINNYMIENPARIASKSAIVDI
ncbi:MAG: hypothetical protein FWD03_05620 [Defluviitaleaceae bacterium]|nr:hypothetical protein [Defluviitaleaceae bacterium]